MQTLVKMPRGRPPADPTRRAKWQAQKEAALQQMGNKVYMVSEITPEVQETDAEIVSRVSKRFKFMEKLLRGAAEGHIRAAVVSGAGGVGKTYMATRILESLKEQDLVSRGIDPTEPNANPPEEAFRFEIAKSRLTAINLYQMLYRNRAKNAVVVLDDCDDAFSDDMGLSILKAALDTSPTRVVQWGSNSNILAANDVPQSFVYEGSMIFLTNIDFTREIQRGTRIAPHLNAFLTRVLYLDLMLHTSREVMCWIDHTVKLHGILIQHGLTAQQQSDVVAWMRANYKRMRTLSIRQAEDIARLHLTYGSEWQDAAEVFMLA